MSWSRIIQGLLARFASNPEDPEVLAQLAELRLIKSPSFDPANASALLALEHSRDGQFLKAIALMKHAVQLNPKLTEAHLLLGQWHAQQGLIGEAVEYFRVVSAHRQALGDAQGALEAEELIAALKAPSRNERA